MTRIERLRLQRKLRLIATMLQTAYDTAWDLHAVKDKLIMGAREDVIKLSEEIRKER